MRACATRVAAAAVHCPPARRGTARGAAADGAERDEEASAVEDVVAVLEGGGLVGDGLQAECVGELRVGRMQCAAGGRRGLVGRRRSQGECEDLVSLCLGLIKGNDGLEQDRTMTKFNDNVNCIDDKMVYYDGHGTGCKQ